MREVLRGALRGSGTATLLVTHDATDVAVLADAVLRLEGGRAVAGSTTLGP